MLMKRSDKVAFMSVGDGANFVRMKNFTDLSTSKNPKEYTRQYVDEDTERNSVVGYTPEIAYAFDADTKDAVHLHLRGIADNELIGDAACVDILIVDLTSEDESAPGNYKAVKRNFSAVADSEGDSTDAYTYSGTFKANGQKVTGTATTTDEWQTCTFTPDKE